MIWKDFLHRHERMEDRLQINEDHVIVDYEDWQKIRIFLENHPEIVKELQLMNIKQELRNSKIDKIL